MPSQWFRQQLLRHSHSQHEPEPEVKTPAAPATTYYKVEVKVTPEIEAARAEGARLQRLAEIEQSPEYQRFNATARQTGMKGDPEKRMEAFQAFQNSGIKDQKAFLGRLQTKFPQDFELNTNQRMNAFLRGR